MAYSHASSMMYQVGVGDMFIWLSGASRRILAECPTERPKYYGLGAAIFITGALAGVSLTFALVDALKVPVLGAIPFAIAWGLAIMMLDRLFVTSMHRQSNPLIYIVQALPRLAIAIVIGFVISTPFVLRVFQPEIQSQVQAMLAQQRQAYYQGLPNNPIEKDVIADQKAYDGLKLQAASGSAPVVVADDPQIKAWTAQQTYANNQVQNWTTQLNCQLYGSKSGGTTCVAGYGPVGRDDQSKIDYWQGQSNTLGQEIAQRTALLEKQSAAGQVAVKQSAQTQLSAAQQALQNAQTQLADETKNEVGSINSDDGILEQLKALSAITASNSSLRDARALLFLLFLFIDVMPVLAKLLLNLLPPTPYDKILADEERMMVRSAESARATRLATRRQLVQAEAAGMRPWLDAMREEVPGLRDDIRVVRTRLEREKVGRFERQYHQDLASGDGLIGTGLRPDDPPATFPGHLPGDPVGRDRAWPPTGTERTGAARAQGPRQGQGPQLLRGRPPAAFGQGVPRRAGAWTGLLGAVQSALMSVLSWLPFGGRRDQGYYRGAPPRGFYDGERPRDHQFGQRPGSGQARPQQTPADAQADPRQPSSMPQATSPWPQDTPTQTTSPWNNGSAAPQDTPTQATSPWNRTTVPWSESTGPQPVPLQDGAESPWPVSANDSSSEETIPGRRPGMQSSPDEPETYRFNGVRVHDLEGQPDDEQPDSV